MFLAFRMANANNFCYYPGHFGRSIELPLAFTRFSRKMTHQIFIGITQNIVTFGFVLTKIKTFVLKYTNEIREPVNHFLAFAKLVRVVEISYIDYAFQVVGFCQFRYDCIDAFANIFFSFEGNHVLETSPLWNYN